MATDRLRNTLPCLAHPLFAGAKFLDRIKKAYDRNPQLASLLVDPEFAEEINGAWNNRSGCSRPRISSMVIDIAAELLFSGHRLAGTNFCRL